MYKNFQIVWFHVDVINVLKRVENYAIIFYGKINRAVRNHGVVSFRLEERIHNLGENEFK